MPLTDQIENEIMDELLSAPTSTQLRMVGGFQGALNTMGYESPAGLALIELCCLLVHANTVKTAEQVRGPRTLPGKGVHRMITVKPGAGWCTVLRRCREEMQWRRFVRRRLRSRLDLSSLQGMVASGECRIPHAAKHCTFAEKWPR